MMIRKKVLGGVGMFSLCLVVLQLPPTSKDMLVGFFADSKLPVGAPWRPVKDARHLSPDDSITGQAEDEAVQQFSLF